eukprot:CAMPEP_0181039886 /NCGR_PEP_ID=MMETSP1070-20121207/10734_1 /TAXON_ID=265543 /ORGANISM="Minutocellus polymorphus, Strain NH13" /LENGTH=32 /DNA_ID= /DNA_START= /DNA_END= /DNA_ORIENTATION=
MPTMPNLKKNGKRGIHLRNSAKDWGVAVLGKA